MKKTKFKNKFKLISSSDKKRIRGGSYSNFDDDNDGDNTNTGGIPPYRPGGQGGDDDRDD